VRTDGPPFHLFVFSFFKEIRNHLDKYSIAGGTLDGILPFLQPDVIIRDWLITVGAPMGKRLNNLLVKPLFHLFLSCVWRQKPDGPMISNYNKTVLKNQATHAGADGGAD
jgi:hypothetical protein